MLRLLRDGFIAVVIDASVRYFLPDFVPILPYAWLGILSWLTFDLLRWQPIRERCSRAYSKFGSNPMSYLVVFLLGGGLLCFYWWSVNSVLAAVQKKLSPTVAEKKIPEPLLTAQLQEIKELEAFIGGKDEGQLWDMFDFPNMIRFNIMRAKACLSALSDAEAAQCNAFFASGGQGHLSLDYGASISRSAGGIIFHDNPSRLNILNTSGKFVKAMETLRSFQMSTRLPTKIKEAVGQLGGAVNDNIGILHQVINEEIEKNPDHILHESDPDSPNFAGASGAFLAKRVWLEPDQKAIISAIEEYLKSL
jgi:hypothetical protein